MYRLYDPFEGSIHIGGQDISKVSLNSLRKAIAVVPQDTVLFHDSLFYNIQYGKPSASVEEVFVYLNYNKKNTILFIRFMKWLVQLICMMRF